MDNIKDMKIKKSLEEIAFSEQTPIGKVAEYIIGVKDVTKLTVKDIVLNCNVTTPTPTRLAQKIGLSGFSQLKVLLELENKIEIQRKEKILSSGLENYKKSIYKTFDLIFQCVVEEQLFQVSNNINKADKIICIAEGTTNYLIEEFCFNLRRLGKNAYCPVEQHDKYITIENSTSNSVLIFISLSGTTKSTMDFIRQAKKISSKKYILTASESIKESENQEVIKINSDESFRQIGSMNTRLAITALFDIIYLNVVKSDYEKNVSIINKTKLRNLK